MNDDQGQNGEGSGEQRMLSKIEERLDKSAAGEVVVSSLVGGVQFQNMLEVMEFSKLMSLAGAAVPKHLRAAPGTCLAVCVQSLEWRMSPFAVAAKSYVVNDRLAYESQLIHAVIEARGPLNGRLRHRYEGEGVERVCIVTGFLKGEQDPFEWKSPPIGKIKTKNSPEWANNPDKQLYYHTSRDWARVYCPDVLLGIYSRDELAHIGPEDAVDVSPNLLSRMPGRAEGAGFSMDHVNRETNGQPQASEGHTEAQADQPATEAQEGAETPQQPSNQAEYLAYAEGWVGVSTNKALAKARWKAERKLRTACNVDISTEAVAALQASIEKLP
jgi:hypothetical protein